MLDEMSRPDTTPTRTPFVALLLALAMGPLVTQAAGCAGGGVPVCLPPPCAGGYVVEGGFCVPADKVGTGWCTTEGSAAEIQTDSSIGDSSGDAPGDGGTTGDSQPADTSPDRDSGEGERVPVDAAEPAVDGPGEASGEPGPERSTECSGECCDGDTRPCYSGPAWTQGVGPCRAGRQTCSGGKWDKQCKGEQAPVVETCNNQDDDCDGQVDELLNRRCTYTGPQGTEGVGACRAGFKTCSAGGWGSCQGEVKPASKEVCGNWKDDDCNGLVEDGCCSPSKIDTLKRTLHGHYAAITALAPSPDGKLLVTGSPDKTLIVWDLQTRATSGRFTGHTAAVTAVTFDPSGRQVASSSDDGTVMIWDPKTVGVAHTLTVTGKVPVGAVAWATVGDRLAAGCADGTIRVWDTTSWGAPKELKGHLSPVTGVAFGRAGKLLYSSSEDHTVRVWDLTLGSQTAIYGPGGTAVAGTACNVSNDCSTGQFCHDRKCWKMDPSRGHTGPVRGVAVSMAGTVVASVSDDGRGIVWDVSTGKVKYELKGHGKPVRGVAYDGSSGGLVTASEDGTARLWDSGGMLVKELKEHRDAVLAAGFLPIGGGPVTGSKDLRVLVWDRASGKPTRTMVGPSHVGGVEFTPDGRYVLAAAYEGVMLFDPGTGSYVRSLEYSGPEYHLTIARKAGIVAAAKTERTGVRLWDLKTGKQTKELTAAATGKRIGISPDGTRLMLSVSSLTSSATYFIDVVTGKSLFTKKQSSNNRVEFSSDGAHVLTADSNAMIALWEFASGKLLRSVGTKYDTASFHPNGKYVGIVGYTGTAEVRLHDIISDLPIRTMKGSNTGYGRWIAFSPAGRVMAVGRIRTMKALSGQIELYDTVTGVPLQTFTLGAHNPTTKAFRNDGGLLAVGVGGEGVRLYGCK